MMTSAAENPRGGALPRAPGGDARSVRVMTAITLAAILYAAAVLIAWRLFLDGRLRVSLAPLHTHMRIATFVGWWVLPAAAAFALRAVRVWRIEQRAAWGAGISALATLIAAIAIFVGGMSMQIIPIEPVAYEGRLYTTLHSRYIALTKQIYAAECDLEGRNCRAELLGRWHFRYPVRMEPDAATGTMSVIICVPDHLEDCETLHPFTD